MSAAALCTPWLPGGGPALRERRCTRVARVGCGRCPPAAAVRQQQAGRRRLLGSDTVVLATRGALDDTGVLPGREPDDGEPAERGVAELVYALLAAAAVGVPPASVLPTFHAEQTPQSYTSALVALGRKQAWETASQVALWVRQQGVLLPSSSFVLLAQRRMDEKQWDRALDPFMWMRDHGCAPSGEMVRLMASLVMEGMPHMRERNQLRDLVAWLRTSDAGRALWKSYVPDGPSAAEAIAGPSWRSQGIAMESGGDIMHAPLDDLKTTLADVVGAGRDGVAAAPGAGREATRDAWEGSEVQPLHFSEIDLLLRGNEP